MVNCQAWQCYLLGIFKIAADAKKKSEEPKMDDNADPSAGIMNVSIEISLHFLL